MIRWLLISLFATTVACSTDTPDDKVSPDTGSDAATSPDAGGMTGDDVSVPEDTTVADCQDGETQDVTCGLNGRGLAEQTCAGGEWGEAGECADPDVCTDGEAQDAPCGRNNRGALPQTCTTGAWADDGACVDPDECTDAEARTVACGLNDRGTQDQTCVDGTWDTSATCNDPDPCTDGTMRDLSCGLNDRGTQGQTCVNGDWENAGMCVDPDACTDGGMQSVTCGLNDRGAQQQACVTGNWIDVGGCVGSDVCVDGTMQDVICGLNNNGTQAQLCTTGAWADQGVCNDPDACINNTTQQVMCGFDGSQDQTCTAGQWVDVGGCIESTVAYCITRPANSQSTVGEASSTIEGVVYVDMKTVGAGAGSGVIGELVWGPTGTAASTWTDVAAAAYSGDADGMTPGDLANDVWQATITAGTVADYDYAFRFSADNGATWQLCDVNGTIDGNFDAGAVGLLETLAPEYADDCRLQFPNVVESGTIGQAVTFYGRVTEPGVAGQGSANANIVGELLVGPAGTDPRPDAVGFQTIAATYNTTALNLAADQDEYEAVFTPTTAGEVAAGFRFSVDSGSHWEYCGLRDLSLPTPSFDPNKMGWMNVTAAPQVVDFCHVWQDTLSDDAATATQPTVTVEVFQAGVTEGALNQGDLVAEAAYFDLEQNPAIATATWNDLPFARRRMGVPQNWEYEGTPYTMATHPPAGEYNVVVRVREAASAEWTYCDIDDTAADFRLEAASRLTVTP